MACYIGRGCAVFDRLRAVVVRRGREHDPIDSGGDRACLLLFVACRLRLLRYHSSYTQRFRMVLADTAYVLVVRCAGSLAGAEAVKIPRARGLWLFHPPNFVNFLLPLSDPPT